MARKLINRIQGKVYGWFDSKAPREMTAAAPLKFASRARLALTNLEDRSVPATFTVTNTLDLLTATANDGSLRGAILAANADAAADTIVFDASFSTPQTITVAGRIAITNPVTITGTQTLGVNNVTISGGNTFGIFSTTSTGAPGQIYVFDKLNLTKGNGGVGGSAGAIQILGQENVTVSNSSVTNNSATLGGAFRLQFAGTSLASPGGTLNLVNSVLSGNTSVNSGTTEGVGGICRITNFANMNITNCLVSNNSASQGAVFITIGSTSVTIDKSTLINNVATNAASSFGARGGIGYLANNTLTPLQVTISNSVISKNTATAISGVFNQTNASQNVTIENSTFDGNNGGVRGAIIYAFGAGTNVVHNSTFTNNTAQEAAVFNLRGGTHNLRNSTFSGNVTTTAAGDGSVVQSYAAAAMAINIDNCTITGNTSASTSAATGYGGAVSIQNNVISTTITSSIISGNTQNGAGGGGFNDVSAVAGTPLTITNSAIGTAAGNTGATNTNNLAFGTNLKLVAIADNGGALQGASVGGQTPAAGKTVGLAAGSPALNVGLQSPTATSSDSLAIATGPQTLNVAGAQPFVTGQLVRFVNTGTPANFMQGLVTAFTANSVTINATAIGGSGTFAAWTVLDPFDQRGVGFNRQEGSGVDIGAFEYVSQTKPTFTKANFQTVTTQNKNDVKINPYVFAVTYTAPENETLVGGTAGTNDVTVTATGNFDGNIGNGNESVTLIPVSASYATTDGNLTGTVTYTVNPNTFTTTGWDFLDSAVYTVNVTTTSLQSSGGKFADAGVVGTFNVAVGTTFVVDLVADEDDGNTVAGDLSLREAIKLANIATPGGAAQDFIVFDPTVFAANQTIALTAALGSLTIPTDMVITGPTASRVTVSAAATGYRLLTVDDTSASTVTASISNITFSGGSLAGSGGAISLGTTDSLTLTNSTVRNSTANGAPGGGVFVGTSGSLALANSTVSGNVAGGSGGGVYFYNKGSLVVTGSTISGNTSLVDGGGVYFFGTATTLRFTNSTLSGNSGVQGGGLDLAGFGGVAEFFNSTVTDNRASVGGGITRTNGTGTLTLGSTIVSGNIAGTNPDISILGGGAAESINATFSAVGVDPGTAWSTSSKLAASKNLAFGASLFLTPLQSNNSGATLTHGLGQGSAAVDAGSAGALTTDQNGAARTIGSAADIGSTEGVVAPPAAQAALPNIFTGAASDNKAVYTFTVTYMASGSATINAGSIGNGDIAVTGPNAYSKTATLTGTTGSGATITATYTVPAAPAGTANWDISDDGLYTVSVVGGEVLDSNSLSVPAGTVGNFLVHYAKSFVVTTVNDTVSGVLDDGDSQLSLREAIERANLLTASGGFGPFPASDTITFFSGTPVNGETDFSQAQTISTASGAIYVSDSVTITGPGSALLTISGGGTKSHFDVDTSAASFKLSGVTLTAGTSAGNGGSVFMNGQTAVFNDVTWNANISAGGGSAILSTVGPDITITNSKITGNFSNTTGTAGTIALLSTVDRSKLTITNSLLDGNTSGSGRGAILGVSNVADIIIDGGTIVSNNKSGATIGGVFFFLGGTSTNASSLTISNSNVNSNTASGFGGVGSTFGTVAVSINGSTISNNSCASAGGVFHFNDAGATANSFTVTNSTIDSNTAAGFGGAVINMNGGNAFVTNSTIFGNVASNGGTFVGGTSALRVGTGNLTIRNSTVTANTTNITSTGNGTGGALATANGTLTIVSSIVSGNVATNAGTPADLSSTSAVAANFSALGSTTGYTLTGGSAANIDGTGINLDPTGLQFNGASTTKTVALLTGSTAIDTGSNPLALTTDQRGAGFARTNGQADIGAFEIQSAVPALSNFTVNGGVDPQRSRIVSIELNFAGPVTPGTFPNLGDIKLVRTGLPTVVLPPGSLVGDVVQSGPAAAAGHITVTQNGANGLKLTFDNNGSFTNAVGTGVEFGSLTDGFWQLYINNTAVSTLGDTNLRRLFGDSSSSALGTVNSVDLTAFGNEFNSGLPAFDFDNNGVVNTVDLTAFGNRFGSVL